MAYADYVVQPKETWEQTKKRLWAMHDRIQDLRNMQKIIGLSNDEDLELRNLDVDFNNQYSDFKSGE